jgi:hypothetical protein
MVKIRVYPSPQSLQKLLEGGWILVTSYFLPVHPAAVESTEVFFVSPKRWNFTAYRWGWLSDKILLQFEKCKSWSLQ